MQSDNHSVSLAAIKHFSLTDECLFDLCLDGPRLRPVFFGSRSNMTYEQNYQSFVGEVACGNWAIVACRKYLWGTNFYWMCDCSAIKEILEYNGSIYQVKRWSQELLAYEFIIIHRPRKIMKNTDAISRYIDPIINKFLVVSLLVPLSYINLMYFSIVRTLFMSEMQIFYPNIQLYSQSYLLWLFTIPPSACFYHILLFLANQPFPFFRVLLFHPKTLRGCHLTQFLIHLALS